MNRKLMSVTFVVATILAGGLQAVQAGNWNAYDGFSGLSNTSGDQWQYSYVATAGQNSDYQLLDSDSSGGWYRSTDAYSLPFVKKVSNDTSGIHEIQAHPGGNAYTSNKNAAAVLGWKNINTGTETVNVSFSLVDRDYGGYAGSDGVEYWLFQSSVSDFLKHGTIDDGGHLDTITATNVSVASGGMLYLQIGPRAYIDSDLTGVTFSVTSVPEPSTLILLAAGLIGLLAYAWRKRK